jgi:branched-chain amino acid transport system substrate-binding protein
MKQLLGALALLACVATARADDVKIGVILPMSGPFSPAGTQALTGMKAWLAQNGDVVDGHRLVLVVRDDTANPTVTKRQAQELVLNDHVAVLAGFGLTPMGAAAAPVATQAKLPILFTGVGSISAPKMSPYVVSVFETLPQVAYPLADWAHKNGIEKVVTLVADYTPGYDTEKAFIAAFQKAGGQIVASLRTPIDTADFNPFLQRALDARPQALVVFQPEGPGGVLERQYHDRGLQQAGVKFLGVGDVVPEELIASGDADFALGAYSAQAYFSGLETPENKVFSTAYKAISKGAAPDIQGVSGYDAIHLIALALHKAGSTDGDALLAAMRGAAWNSPRGPVRIGESRAITQTIYVRQFQKVDGTLRNVVIASYPDVPPDPQ